MTAINYMSKENNGNGGVILNISSIVGLEPNLNPPIYTASKHAVLGFTRSLGVSSQSIVVHSFLPNDLFYFSRLITFMKKLELNS